MKHFIVTCFLLLLYALKTNEFRDISHQLDFQLVKCSFRIEYMCGCIAKKKSFTSMILVE